MSRQRDVLKTWLGMLEVTEAIKKRLDMQLRAQFGVSLSGFDILAALHAGDPKGLRAGVLSQKLRVSDGATTQLVATLEKTGLIARAKDENDGRVVLVRISEQGLTLFEDMARAHHAWLLEAFAALKLKDLNQIVSLIGTIDPHALIATKITESV
ncbi:MarR family winged helix-turn-helix transcriptional regulator [Hyphomonas sp. KY3]|jgi:DNA-binding MarR family transcriptional regulator|uniref:MarR family winged helix-turn-helix transcriptional regulator n=1 Tax=Hyphomonas sp. KY3 TaxID=2016196 RepID=UPI001A8D2526|nr:MarR family transcriptional regulator [Hyphomonas sp. KY3]QSR22065.1 hypothetical protein CFA77_07120 [Hyphomonas sp. KY3]|tara:strand:+ start:176 stop:640 length:465 start_codon:yes stop_codon:yes gene_type:complete